MYLNVSETLISFITYYFTPLFFHSFQASLCVYVIVGGILLLALMVLGALFLFKCYYH